MLETIINVALWVVPVIVAITFHEAAHGFAAHFYGDNTAKRLGRLTLNPIAHVDRVGTIVLPLLLFLLPGNFIFGYAKPVPVNTQNLNNPRWDMAKVAFAGPGMNFLLAALSALLLQLVLRMPTPNLEPVLQMLEISIFFNILLGLFNLIPIPPLDGGRVLTALLPASAAAKFQRLEPAGIFIVLGTFFLLPMLAAEFGLRLNLFRTLIAGPAMLATEYLIGVNG